MMNVVAYITGINRKNTTKRTDTFKVIRPSFLYNKTIFRTLAIAATIMRINIITERMLIEPSLLNNPKYNTGAMMAIIYKIKRIMKSIDTFLFNMF